ncbi:hypothetical protein P3W43_01570 [Salinicola salarius]|uniref:hypothetical protein n=1 Tax=Salinicola salarius TaxID=430457 RepID=UPI0023E4537E|nr:hypothetical protein [Salinicola salarius]MDF3917538.1 hypothetical protein [Salinicola salarius]
MVFLSPRIKARQIDADHLVTIQLELIVMPSEKPKCPACDTADHVYLKNTVEKAGTTIGAGAGAVSGYTGATSGAAAGAAIGSFVPLVGTFIGGIAGGIVGGLAGAGTGAYVGNKVGEQVDKAFKNYKCNRCEKEFQG